MRFFVISLLAMLLACPTVAAEVKIGAEQLVGDWVFESWAEQETPDRKTPVNRLFRFLPDGTVEMPGRGTSASYAVTGNEIIWSDESGDQHWVVVSYEGEELVVQHKRALMYLVKTDNE